MKTLTPIVVGQVAPACTVFSPLFSALWLQETPNRRRDGGYRAGADRQSELAADWPEAGSSPSAGTVAPSDQCFVSIDSCSRRTALMPAKVNFTALRSCTTSQPAASATSKARLN